MQLRGLHLQIQLQLQNSANIGKTGPSSTSSWAVHTGSVAECSAYLSVLCSAVRSYTGSVAGPLQNQNQ